MKGLTWMTTYFVENSTWFIYELVPIKLWRDGWLMCLSKHIKCGKIISFVERVSAGQARYQWAMSYLGGFIVNWRWHALCITRRPRTQHSMGQIGSWYEWLGNSINQTRKLAFFTMDLQEVYRQGSFRIL